MRVVVIGGKGHIGTYLVPQLVVAGHKVINVSRGDRKPYQPSIAWDRVQQVVADRATEDAAGTFAGRILDLQPDVVIDMICFTKESARQMVEALRGRVQHLITCGTVWVHGTGVVVPATEDQPRNPIEDYGRNKAALEEYLLNEFRSQGFPVTIIHPGHIVGPGWVPVNPVGNFNPQVFEQLARGEELAMPNLGLETLHHVHADDVAQLFMRALADRRASLGESFNVVSPAALTFRGYAESVAAWFGQPARLRFLPWEEWRKTVTEQDATTTWAHLAHSTIASIAKAQRLLSYQPQYSSLEAVYTAVDWLIENGLVRVSRNPG